MATNISTQTVSTIRPMRIPRILIARILNVIHIPLPRRRTLLTSFLFFGGLSIPVLMMFSILPLSFLLAFVGFAMTSTGGVLALVFCGGID
jgi:hypothetical protein